MINFQICLNLKLMIIIQLQIQMYFFLYILMIQFLNNIPLGSSCVLSFSNFDNNNSNLNRIKNMFIGRYFCFVIFLKDFFNNGRIDTAIISNISYMIHFTCISASELIFKIVVYKYYIINCLKYIELQLLGTLKTRYLQILILKKWVQLLTFKLLNLILLNMN